MLRSCIRILATIAILALAGLATAWAEDVDVGLDFEARLAQWNQSLDIIGDATISRASKSS